MSSLYLLAAQKDTQRILVSFETCEQNALQEHFRFTSDTGVLPWN